MYRASIMTQTLLGGNSQQVVNALYGGQATEDRSALKLRRHMDIYSRLTNTIRMRKRGRRKDGTTRPKESGIKNEAIHQMDNFDRPRGNYRSTPTIDH
jgi:hypothetical protein